MLARLSSCGLIKCFLLRLAPAIRSLREHSKNSLAPKFIVRMLDAHASVRAACMQLVNCCASGFGAPYYIPWSTFRREFIAASIQLFVWYCSDLYSPIYSLAIRLNLI